MRFSISSASLSSSPTALRPRKSFLTTESWWQGPRRSLAWDLPTRAWSLSPRSGKWCFWIPPTSGSTIMRLSCGSALPTKSGFPAGEPEIVFKFRHDDMQKVAALDVRPNIAGNYRIKFKAEALPLKDQVGGYRLLFSHNAQFPLSQAPEGDRTSMGTLARVFPALAALKTSDNRQGRIGEPDHRRGGASGPRRTGLWQGRHRRREYRHLARARHSPSVVRRVRVPGQVQAPGRTSTRRR